MLPGQKAGFELDTRLESASVPALWLGLCELRVVNERRWPWLLLVPQRNDIEEMHDLTPLDQAMLTFELNMVSKALQSVTDCQTVNISIMGNVVRQLHINVVARSRRDEAWPGPVWDVEPLQPYQRDALRLFLEKLRSAM
jgi:diadenosine tetraphosphate (Ap4A) HIT family hydrolase